MVEETVRMRRSEREITDKAGLKEILDDCKVCRIAVVDEEGIYIVPVNFGYQYEEDTLTLYFHSAKGGRKARAFAVPRPVGFEMDVELGLKEGIMPCNYSFAYQSIIGTGRVVSIDDVEEKIRAMNVIASHIAQKEFELSPVMLEWVGLYRLEVEHFTGKVNPI